jgi:hypothetical protein
VPSKRFRGLLCVYCTVRSSQVGDHVFAREFFALRQRDNLPQVPACNQCNTEKSKVEHYLTTVLPFAGRHPDSKQMLTDFVPRRLAKNQALSRKVRSGMQDILIQDSAGNLQPTVSIPIDPDALKEWAAYVARGLLWHHWHVLLDGGGDVEVYSLTQAGEQYFKTILRRPARERVVESLGDGTFRYTGAQAVDNPQMSVWVIEPYGGAMVGGEGEGPNNVSRNVGAFTAPAGTLAHLLRSAGGAS